MIIGITGHSGFIGRKLIEKLSTNQHIEIKLFDRNKHTLSDYKSLRSFVSNTDAIVHLAGTKKDFGNYTVNTLGTKHLLEAVRVYSPTTAIVFASSFAVYAAIEDVLDEELSPTLPINHYGLTKLFAEELLEFYTRNYKTKTRILRIANVYGQTNSSSSDFVSLLLSAIDNHKTLTIKGTGEQTRDFIYIDDVVTALSKAIFYNKQFLRVNICTGKKTTLNSLISLVEEGLQKTVRVKRDKEYFERGLWIGRITRAQKLLNFTATIDLKTGIQKMLSERTNKR